MGKVVDESIYEYSAQEYADEVTRWAYVYKGDTDLLNILPWAIGVQDPYYRTRIGVLRYKCALSLEFLCRNVLKPGCEWSDSHSLMCREAERTNLYLAVLGADIRNTGHFVSKRIRRKAFDTKLKNMYLMFRGYFKTTTFNCAHAIQESLINPDIRTLIISGTLDNAKEILSMIKSHYIHNPIFRALFPEYCPVKSKTGKIEWGTTEEATLPNRTDFAVREPSFKIGSPTSKLTGTHFIRMKIDDLIDQNNCTNEDQIANCKNIFQLMLNLFDNPARPFFDVIGTRFHHDDLYGWLMETEASNDGTIEIHTFNPDTPRKLEKYKKKVADKSEGDQDIKSNYKFYEIPIVYRGDMDSKPIFPERLPMEAILHMHKEQGPYNFSCQNLLNPVPPDDQTFLLSWLKFYDVEEFKKPLRIVMSVDPANSLNKRSDSTSIIIHGFDEKQKWYVLDMFKDKLEVNDRVEKVISLNQYWRQICGRNIPILYESYAFQNTDIAILNRRLREERIYIDVVEFKAKKQAKEDRIRGLQPFFSRGDIYLPKTCVHYSKYEKKKIDMIDAFKSEYMFFPKAKHDDLMDNLSFVLSWDKFKTVKARAIEQPKKELKPDMVGATIKKLKALHMNGLDPYSSYSEEQIWTAM